MRHAVLHLLCLIALVLQGSAAAGASLTLETPAEQHCPEHSSVQENCDCCPDGETMGLSCSAQCSVSQAPVALNLPGHVAMHRELMPAAQRFIRNPAYTPLTPPPIE
jgi:hypothetical protein